MDALAVSCRISAGVFRVYQAPACQWFNHKGSPGNQKADWLPAGGRIESYQEAAAYQIVHVNG